MSYLTNYPGAKTNSGIIQFLINNIPYHKRYFELFCGSAQLYCHKAAADIAILGDIDSGVIVEHLKNNYPSDVRLYNMPFKNVAKAYELTFSRNDFIYLDPPYPKEARRNGKSYYKHEMLESDDHLQFLEYCKTINANVMISTRKNDLYDIVLSDWRVKEFETVGRMGKEVELIYMNYPEPEILHQYDYVGQGFSDRQRIKRKRQRMEQKIKDLPMHEKMAILQDIVLHNYEHVKFFLANKVYTDQ